MKHIRNILTCGLVALPAFVGAPTDAAEFHEDDVRPYISSIVFSQDRIALSFRASTYLGRDIIHFAARRDGFEFRALDHESFSEVLNSNHYHRFFDVDARLRDGDGGYELRHRELTMKAENRCSTDMTDRTSLSHPQFELSVVLQCGSRIHDAVLHNDLLWLATFVDPEYSYDMGISPEGLLVTSLDGEILARVPTGSHAVHGLAVDPWSDDVWIVTHDRLLQVGSDLTVKRQFWPILEFDDATGKPGTIVRSSATPLTSNPLALIARGLGEPHYAALRDASENWPELREQDVMYNYAMNGPDWAWMPMLPRQLNALIEYAQPTGSWRRFACLLDDERAEELCLLDLELWP